MSKQAMNMQLSQISHGVVKGSDYENSDENVVELGYRPAMVKGILMDSSDDPLHRFWFYSVEGDYTFTMEDTDSDDGSAGDGFAREESDSFIEVTENGFILDGTEAAKVNGTPAGFLFEAYGGKRTDTMAPDTSPEEAHPDEEDADTAMDTTDYLPEL